MQIEVYEFFETYFYIRKYIEKIQDKIKDIFVEEVEIQESAFDEYDKENGYEDEIEEIINIYDSYLNVINNVIHYSIKRLKNSLADTLQMDILDLLDYIEFAIEKDKEEQDMEEIE